MLDLGITQKKNSNSPLKNCDMIIIKVEILRKDNPSMMK